jgi:hypothetical protein
MPHCYGPDPATKPFLPATGSWKAAISYVASIRRTRLAGNVWRGRLATLPLWAASRSASCLAWRFLKPLPVAGCVSSWRDFGARPDALAARWPEGTRPGLISITVVGEVRADEAILRSGAKPGDLIFVTGRLGEAELGLHSVRSGRTLGGRGDLSIKKHLYPEPRLALGQWLARRRIASAMMDLSDGLSSDLSRLCAASRVGARIAIGKIPKVKVLGGKAPKHLDATELALHGGDDYELLFTVRPSRAQGLPAAFEGVPLTCIGEITRERRLLRVGLGEREETLAVRGWDPFRRRE